MTDPHVTRIGDAERDEAAALLRDHMAAGRLDHDEFDDRLGKALTAHTQTELDALFDDLPSPRPGESRQAVEPAPFQPYPAGGSSTHGRHPATSNPTSTYRAPWWTHWGLFVGAIFLSAITRGELGPIIPIAVLWVWWLGPTIARSMHDKQVEEERRRRELGR